MPPPRHGATAPTLPGVNVIDKTAIEVVGSAASASVKLASPRHPVRMPSHGTKSTLPRPWASSVTIVLVKLPALARSTPTATADRPHRAAKRYIFAWGDGRAEGDATMRDLLAGLSGQLGRQLPVTQMPRWGLKLAGVVSRVMHELDAHSIERAHASPT